MNPFSPSVTLKASIKPQPTVSVSESIEETSKSVRKRLHAIEQEFKSEIGSIPLSHEYWGLVNKYRQLLSEGK